MTNVKAALERLRQKKNAAKTSALGAGTLPDKVRVDWDDLNLVLTHLTPTAPSELVGTGEALDINVIPRGCCAPIDPESTLGRCKAALTRPKVCEPEIRTSHFKGFMPITSVLYALASQEGNDGDEGHAMQMAADYIRLIQSQGYLQAQEVDVEIWYNSDGEFGQVQGWLIKQNDASHPLEKDKRYKFPHQPQPDQSTYLQPDKSLSTKSHENVNENNDLEKTVTTKDQSAVIRNLAESVVLLLPLARGYAAHNPDVKVNQRIINLAKDHLTKHAEAIKAGGHDA